MGLKEDRFCNGVDNFSVWQPLVGSQCLQVVLNFTLLLHCHVKWAWAREKENSVQGAMEFMAAFGFLCHLGQCGKGELQLLGMLAQVDQ